jgi:predicted DNA-binding protein
MLFGALQPSAGSAPLQSQPVEVVTLVRVDAAVVEMFASHPPQRTRKDGAPSWLAGAKGWARSPDDMSDIYVIMSDMASNRITIRIPETLGQRLRHRSLMRGQPESALVREALETYLGQPTEARPAYELAEEAGLIGCIGRGPKSPAKDLSTNPRHLEGFGKSK